jgi:hypothetical protein
MTDQLRSQPMSKHTQSSPVSDNQPFDDTRKLTMALGEMSRAERENIELGRRLEAAEAYIEELKAELRAQAATAQVPPNTTGGALCPKPPCTAFPDCGCVAQPDAAATAQPKSLDRNKIAEAICDPGFLGHFHASGSTGGIFRYKYEQIADRVIAAISNDAAQPDAAATAQTPFCTCPCSCDETPHDGSKCPVHDTVTDWEDVEQRTNIRAPAQPAPAKSLSDYTDGEIATEYYWRAQQKLGDPMKGVSMSSAERKP